VTIPKARAALICAIVTILRGPVRSGLGYTDGTGDKQTGILATASQHHRQGHPDFDEILTIDKERVYRG
jgi:hypothetical protein